LWVNEYKQAHDLPAALGSSMLMTVGVALARFIC
jgi:hypothetical protein